MAKSTITGVGVFGNTEAQVDPSNRALRVSLRPAEKGVYGSYSLGLNTGVMAAGLAAASPVFEFRWSSASVNALIKRLRISAGCDTTAFGAAAASAFFELVRATAFTVTDATGASNVVFTGKTGAKSTRFAPSQIQQATTSNIVISNTAALSAGTKTVDGSALATVCCSTGLTGAGQQFLPPTNLWDPTEAGKEFIELQANEGVFVRATVPGTGTWRMAVDIEWDEIDPARYLIN